MSKEKKGRRWDGKSRVSTELYRRRFNEIFKKNEENKKSDSSAPKKSALSTDIHLNPEVVNTEQLRKIEEEYTKYKDERINFKVNAEIVNGTCPHCKLQTVLVCLWQGNIYRCMGCGYDVEQKVNGKISYIPYVSDPDKFQYRMKVDTDGK